MANPGDNDAHSTTTTNTSLSDDAIPRTLSCANCERIIGDTSTLLSTSLTTGALTVSSLISTKLSPTLTTAPEGAVDEFCNYRSIHCQKCDAELGKRYLATMPAFAAVQGHYTLNLEAISIYTPGSHRPSLPVATGKDVVGLLHPEPNDLVRWIQNLMSVCVSLRDEQTDIVEELKRVGEKIGYEVRLESEDSGYVDDEQRSSLREKINSVEGGIKDLKSELETAQAALRIVQEKLRERSSSPRRNFTQPTSTARTEKNKEPAREIERARTPLSIPEDVQREASWSKELAGPPKSQSKRKRTSMQAVEVITINTDSSRPPPTPPPPRREVPNSQSTGEPVSQSTADSSDKKPDEYDYPSDDEEDERVMSSASKRKRQKPTEKAPLSPPLLSARERAKKREKEQTKAKGKEPARDLEREKGKAKEREKEKPLRRKTGRNSAGRYI